MFNLLPESLKKDIRKDYNLRRVVLILIFLLFIGGTFLVFMFPSWIISVYKEKEVALRVENSQSSLETEVKEVSSNIQKVNSELRTIDTALSQKKLIPIINIILAQRTKSIAIKEITYDLESASRATIFIEGVSATRSSLLSFVKSLEETKSFKVVNLPISSFAKERNIGFSLNLILE